MTIDDEMVIDLSDAEVQELEAAYGIQSPKPEKAAAPKAEAKAPAKAADAAPVKAADNDLLRRAIQAEERVAAERAKRIEAERLAHERGASAAVNAARAAESDYHAVSNALTKAASEAEQLKAAHLAALESGDYAKATDAAARMAEAAAKISQLTEGKSALEDRVRQAKAQAETASKAEPPKADVPSDPLDAFLAQSGMPPRAQAWFRAHPEAAPINDPAMYHKALAAHYSIVKSGVQDGSDDYYAKLDELMGFADGGSGDDAVVDTKPKDDVVVDTAKPAPKAPAPRVAAPVSRDTSIMTRRPDGRMQVRLTREQAEIAEAMGISPSAYAKQLLRAEQEGRLNRV
jgi:hypothetical protein